jgi:serine phosphatase RsbU (regulator of sigma subunit)
VTGDHTLTELSEVVASHETVETVLFRVVESACQLVADCVAASVTLIDGDRVTTPVHTHPIALELDGVQYDLGAGPCLEAIHIEKPVLWFTDDGRWPPLGEECRRRDVGAVLSVPLASGECVLGALNLYSQQAGGLAGEIDRSTVVVLAEQAAVALATSLALEEQRKIAITLQDHLLPRDLPSVPGYEFASCYRPASATAEIGGDWYDAYRLEPDGPVVATIGDVQGHNIEAASVMVRVRTALRAYTLEGHHPTAALELTGRLMTVSDAKPESLFATACLVLLDPDTGACHVASAGHLPAAIRQGDGSVQYVTVLGGAALGVDVEDAFGEEFFTLEQGATLVLFTDGLVETRGGSLDDGFERLAAALSGAPDSAVELCDHLVEEMQRWRVQEDDVALLVIRHLSA